MVVWHHQLNGYEFERSSGDREAWLAIVQRVRHDLVTEQQQQDCHYCY